MKPIRSSVHDRPSAGASPTRPAGLCLSPTRMSPRRKVPVVSTAAPQVRPRPSSQAGANRAVNVDGQFIDVAFDHRPGWRSRIARYFAAA
jgi:hypothetical protein